MCLVEKYGQGSLLNSLKNCDVNSKISIITVNYNSGKDIARTFESIKSQKCKNFEYVVIDGNSNDLSADVIEQNKDIISKLIIEDDNGIYDAMNKGIRVSSGEWLLFLNSGDTLDSEVVIMELIQTISKKGQSVHIGGFYSDTKIKGVNGKDSIQYAKEFNRLNLLIYGTRMVCHQSVIYRKEALSSYSLSYVLKGELDSYLKLLSDGYRFEYFPRVISNFYLGGRNNHHFLLNAREAFGVFFKHFNILALLALPNILYRLIRNIVTIDIS